MGLDLIQVSKYKPNSLVLLRHSQAHVASILLHQLNLPEHLAQLFNRCNTSILSEQ